MRYVLGTDFHKQRWTGLFLFVGGLDVLAYDQGESEKAEINSFWTIWFPPILMILFGLMCLGAGSVILRRTGNS